MQTLQLIGGMHLGQGRSHMRGMGMFELAIVRWIVRRMAETSTSVEEYAAHLEGRPGAPARPRGRVPVEWLVQLICSNASPRPRA
jgi:hypothetical protein